MPLRTIDTFSGSQPASGCAFAWVTPPCVAQRVWPSPVVADDGTVPARSFRLPSGPTARTYASFPSSSSARPEESYPRYSRRSSPWNRSGLHSRDPTYPMIPHTTWTSLRNAEEPGGPSVGLAELLGYQGRDATTQTFGLLLRFRLGEHPNDGLGAGWPHEDAASLAELVGEPIGLVEDGAGNLAAPNADVPLRLGVVRQDRR